MTVELPRPRKGSAGVDRPNANQPNAKQLSASRLAAMLPDPSARGIADQLGHLISTGTLVQGTRLPSIRALAAALQVGTTTVASAWAQLRDRDLVSSDRRHGSIVRGPGALAGRRYVAVATDADVRLDLSTALPDPALLPDLATAVVAAAQEERWGGYPDEVLDRRLASTVRADWPFPAQQLTATHGGHDAIDRVAEVLLQPHDKVLVEQVTAASLLDIIDDHAAEPVAVACDDHGPLPESLRSAMSARPKMLLLQPRMASPHGHALTHERARELAAVLRGADIVIAEDDPAPALAPVEAVSLGEFLPGQTILARSWNKSHGPHLRIGVLGGARTVVTRVRARQLVTGSWPSGLNQRTLAVMLGSAEVQAAVRRARHAYVERRGQLVDALRDRGLHPAGVAGLSVWVHVDAAATAISRLAEDGIGIAHGKPFVAHGDGSAQVRIGTTVPHDAHAHIAQVLSRSVPARAR